ncbi:MAG: cell division protein SepF [Lachnospiraceae bacterium]|nr:cell division protein SepF [Lachnospiraceae bacterium]
MGVFGKIIDSMKINPDAEDDEYYDDDDEYEVEETPHKSFFKRNKDIAEEYTEDEEQKQGLFTSKKNITPVKRYMEVTMIKPTTVADSRTITDNLLSGKAVVLNMEGLPTDLAQRIIDFTSGATYSMRGKLQSISNYIFIATPSQVELSGDFQDFLNSGQFDVTGMKLRF